MKRRFENLTKGAARAIKHWWLLAVAGILCILLGIVVFAFPLGSYVTLAILFGVRSVPTLFFIPTQGNPQRTLGVMPKRQIEERLNDLLKN